MVKVLKTHDEYEDALARAEELITLDPEADTLEGEELELLTLVIRKYEDEHFPIRKPTAIEAILFRMEQQGLKQRDLMPMIGSRGRVSEVLRGKRPLTLRMIRSLHKELGIPAEVLLQEPGASLPEDAGEFDWERFPLKEMVSHGWVTADSRRGKPKEQAEELVREFLHESCPSWSSAAMPARHFRNTGHADEYALTAWCARAMRLARDCDLQSEYESGTVTKGFVRDLAKLSYLGDGPALAKEYLARSGICLVLLHHLPGTRLDGAAMLREDGTPVVALTLRHDRVDNYWYTLAHELAHVALHLDKDGATWFFDDLDVEGDAKEAEADRWAADALIPPGEWKKAAVRTDPTMANVRDLAERLRISPAIVAGRARYEHANYRILARLVGNGEVRVLFGDIEAGVA